MWLTMEVITSIVNEFPLGLATSCTPEVVLVRFLAVTSDGIAQQAVPYLSPLVAFYNMHENVAVPFCYNETNLNIK